MAPEKLFTRDEVREQFRKYELTAREAHKMMGIFGLKQVSDPKVLRRFESTSTDETQPNAETLRSISAFLVMLAAAHSAAPTAPYEETMPTGEVRSPLPVPVMGMTKGANIIKPLDLYDLRREIYVPIFADTHRWASGEVPLRAVLFTTAVKSKPLTGKIAKPNYLLNGWAALINMDYRRPASELWVGAQNGFWAVVRFAEHCPKMVERGADPDIEVAPTLIAQVISDLENEQLVLRDGADKKIVALQHSDVEKIWPVTAFLPKNHY